MIQGLTSLVLRFFSFLCYRSCAAAFTSHGRSSSAHGGRSGKLRPLASLTFSAFGSGHNLGLSSNANLVGVNHFGDQFHLHRHRDGELVVQDADSHLAATQPQMADTRSMQSLRGSIRQIHLQLDCLVRATLHHLVKGNIDHPQISIAKVNFNTHEPNRHSYTELIRNLKAYAIQLRRAIAGDGDLWPAMMRSNGDAGFDPLRVEVETQHGLDQPQYNRTAWNVHSSGSLGPGANRALPSQRSFYPDFSASLLTAEVLA